MSHPVATADCIAWYRGDSLVDGGGAVASSWEDKTASAYHLSSSGDPTIVTASDLGSGVRLAARMASASSQFFSRATTPALSQPYTMVAVLKATANSGSITGTNSGTQSDVFMTDPDKVGVYAGGADFFDGDLTQDAWHLLEVTLNGASSRIAVDGVEEATGTIAGGGLTGLRIGVNLAGGFLYDGDIAEVVLWNKALDAGERTALYDYYQTYYLGVRRSRGYIIF